MLKSKKRIISLITAVAVSSGFTGVQEIKAIESEKNDETVHNEPVKDLTQVKPSVTTSAGVTVEDETISEDKDDADVKEDATVVVPDDTDYKHLRGQLHSHTDISDGKGSLSEAYEWAKKEGKADYYAVTDHSNWFDNDTSGNISDGSASTKWTKAHETADKFNEDPDFTAIYGYEMTWSGSTGGWGHMNTFNTPGFETRTNTVMRDIIKYYDALETQPDSISQFNHPGKTFGDFADFAYYNKERDKLINLVEVGNGEGAIRSSGYFPSYEYYTRALDKGWHLAPTNSQDNHKGYWMTSNDARTVILAEDNSRDSIYDAMREKRVYACEDKNLNIEYTVNGQQMGSTLGEVDELQFNININDPDYNDKIKKVSIISNGGYEVISKEFDSNTVEWNFTLKPEFDYYYVRVDEEDKDIAVTAPVWAGQSLNVGMQPLTSENKLIVQNKVNALNTGIYNNSGETIENLNINFYCDSKSEGNKIGSEKIESIESGKEESVSFNWVPKKAGEYTIYAETKISVGGKEKSFTTSIKVKVVSEEDTFKVVLDGAHYNKYVSGDYAGKYTALKSLLEDKNAVTYVNKEPITDETLKGASILILSNPQSTDYNGLKASKFEDSEVAAIKRFVEGGGNVILSTVADFKDGKDEYSNGNQMNKVLEAIGTEIRINDDEVIDKTTNGGQEYRLYLTNYNKGKYNLTNGIGEDEQYSFYSGASIILADGAKGENVDFFVKGFETTETLDSDKQGDNTLVEKGNVSVIAAEQLENGAKIIVGGNTFFSDFEIDGTNGDKYSNKKVVSNIANWMLPEKQKDILTISEIRKDENNDGIPDLLGKECVIEGYVTSQSEAISPKNSFFEVIYLDDGTGGLCVFGISSTPLKVGQKVRVTGTVDEYQGEFELQIKDEDSDLQIIDETEKVMTPLKLSTNESMLPKNGGKLVQVEGKVVKMDEQNLYIDDGSGISRVYVEGYIWDGIDESTKGKWDSSIKVGDKVSVIGLASKDPEGARLRVRNTGEIKKVTTDSGSGSGSGSDSDSNGGNDNNENQSGWIKQDGVWVYIDESGNKKIGWLKDVDGKWYHLSNSGAMSTGWLKDTDGKWYHLSNSGAMSTGWLKDTDGKWYHLSNSGAMSTGWLKDTDGKWYYLTQSGSMAVNTTIDGYRVDHTGAWVK